MRIIILIYANSVLESVCEDIPSAINAENELSKLFNDLFVKSVMHNSLDECWLSMDRMRNLSFLPNYQIA